MNILRALALTIPLFLAILLGVLPSVALSYSDTPVRPLFTRYAETYSNLLTVDAAAYLFEDVLLQEAENFDGYGMGLDLTVALSKRFQLQLLFPLYTKGEATLIPERHGGADPLRVDLRGSRVDTFEWPSVILEYQFLRSEQNTGWNAAALLGYGWIDGHLGVYWNDSLIGRYNHQGNKIIGGFKADKDFAGGAYGLAANLKTTYFATSDDIGPDNEDAFVLVELNAALVFKRLHQNLSPAIEMLYTDTLKHYRSLSLAPELLFRAGRHLDLKLGVPIRIAGDGQRLGASLGITLRY